MTIVRSYGWRPSHPDPRDAHFAYRASPHILKALPPSLDLDAPSPGAPFDPCWDQSSLGSCGPNTESENLVWDMLKAVGSASMPSRLFIYYVTRSLMGTVDSDSGVDNRTMLKALNQYGWCDESLWPYDISKYTQKPPPNCFDQAATRTKSIKYQSVSQDLNQMKACLVELGKPFIFGFSVFASMETAQVDKTGDVPMPGGLLDGMVGGHDVLIVGYDDATQRFKFKNHWTPQWGNKGYGTIPYAYATDPKLAGDFWVVTAATAGDTPVPTPVVSNLQQLIDSALDYAAKQFPAEASAIAELKSIVDWVFSLFASPASLKYVKGPIKDLVDGAFASFEATMAGRPIVLMALKIVQKVVDDYLAAQGL